MKRGQIKLSFGMIFSLILIAIFIAIAIYAIIIILELQEKAKLLNFKESLQSDVDKAWKSPQSVAEKEYLLPGGIQEICFEQKSSYDENLFFEPEGVGGVNQVEIEHIDIEKIAGNKEYCIDVENGRVKLGIEKRFDKELVTLRRK